MRPRVDYRIGGGLLCVAVALAFSVAAEGAPQRRTASREFTRTLTVQQRQSLRLDHRHGDIRIRAHAGSELQIRAAIKVSAGSSADADALLDDVRIDVEEAPTSIVVRTHYPEEPSRQQEDLSFSVDYTIVMPETMTLDVTNRFGDLTVESLKAKSTLVNSHGRVAVTDCTGEHKVENAFGATEGRRIGGNLSVISGNGNVRTEDIQGTLTIDNRFGDVRAARVGGAATLTNTNGAVEVSAAASAVVTNAFGSVKLRDISGDAIVSNGNGAVDARGIGGKAELKTSFSTLSFFNIGKGLTVTATNTSVEGRQVGGPISITTTFGAVDVQDLKAGIKVSNGNSTVRLVNVAGSAYVKTSFGAVRAEGVRGGLTVDNANGGVEASSVAGSAQITTSFGGVVLKEVDGTIDVKNRNGAIDVAPSRQAQKCHDLTLATSFSPIHIRLREDSSYVLNARVTFGRISSDLPVTASGTMAEGSLSGTIGSGGCSLRATTTNGDIRIQKLAARR
ncbi:MAG: hypothetical protein GEV06_08600 [Luteitalea sp.]|nr:hypothetical protein [Luteitalea sp.]